MADFSNFSRNLLSIIAVPSIFLSNHAQEVHFNHMVANIWFLLTFLAIMLKTYGVIPARGTNIYFTDEETKDEEGLTVKEDMVI